MDKQQQAALAMWESDLVALGACCGSDWIITEGNASLARLLETARDRMIGRSLRELLAARDLERAFVVLQSRGENSPSFFQKEDSLFVLQWQWDEERKTGSGGERLFSLLQLDRSWLQASNAAALRELNALFDSIHDGIWVIDSRGITVRVNKAVEKMTGLSSRELIGRHVTAPMKEGKYSSCVTLRALRDRAPVTMFDDYANGKRFLNTSVPVFDDAGGVWRVIGYIRDMSMLEELQARLTKLERANCLYKHRLQRLEEKDFSDFAGSGPTLRHLLHDLSKVARSDAPALILGETGTGKTIAARAVHKASPHRDGPFMLINCGAIPASLLESELFGYEKGAFTGAQKTGKVGLLDAARGGTVFFDEIGDLPLDMQGKLLHVLDGQPFTRIGGVKPRHLQSRVLAATNKSLDRMVREGSFREDLYYRLHVLTITLPPLRERTEDIPDLIGEFLRIANGKNSTRKIFAPDVFPCFSQYSWPGNVRELRATVEYLVAMAENDIIAVADLPERIRAPFAPREAAVADRRGLPTLVAEFERNLVARALAETGSTWKAAQKLKISQSTVVRKAMRYRIGTTAVVHS
ncbi:MAG: sigma 54-interacting transcriptional regulator [Desulfovibrio sp.]|jgi:PAS domain S-box-containing protein|nr:sigma 54-interacting transcriptional regulator [Desulfovibrio sp.]